MLRPMLVSPLLLCGLLVLGCAQSTDSVQPVTPSAPADSRQEATGSQTNINTWVVNNYQGRAMEGVEAAGDAADVFARAASSGAQNDVGTLTGRALTQAGLTVNITTGGTTGAQTATQSPAATGTATATQSPEQKPEAAVTVPIAVGMPGSAPQATGAATRGDGSPVTQTPTLNAELRTALLREAQAGSPTAAAILRMFGVEPPATQPAP